MIKQTKTIRRQKPTNCLSVSEHFLGLTPKGLSIVKIYLYFVASGLS